MMLKLTEKHSDHSLFYFFLKKVLTKLKVFAIISLVVKIEWYGSLAQLGEHLPYKQRVTGSSPVTPTIIFNQVVR